MSAVSWCWFREFKTGSTPNPLVHIFLHYNHLIIMIFCLGYNVIVWTYQLQLLPFQHDTDPDNFPNNILMKRAQRLIQRNSWSSSPGGWSAKILKWKASFRYCKWSSNWYTCLILWSDQHFISSHIISTLSSAILRRIKELIIKQKLNGSHNLKKKCM